VTVENRSGRTPWVRSGRCESFIDPGEWVAGAIACRDAGTPPSRSFASVREADRLISEGMELPEVFKQLEVAEATYHRWRNQYGGMKADDVKRLKELETENARLKRIVADQVLENQALREVARGRMKVKLWSGPSLSLRLVASR
jgi:putative transposase